jgi:hypothetical protein
LGGIFRKIFEIAASAAQNAPPPAPEKACRKAENWWQSIL